MFALVIGIVIFLAVFGFVMWIFLCLNSSKISKVENEREYKMLCDRARKILRRRNNDVQKED